MSARLVSGRSPRLLWITPAEGSLAAMRQALERELLALGDDKDTRELVVLLRRPAASTRGLLEEGRALSATGAPLLVSRRVDVALALGALGVHLPERGVSVGDARALLGPAKWIGVSRHDRAGLTAAAAEGADYATLSPFAATPGKGTPLGAAAFARARAGIAMPVLALGGIDAAVGREALAAGADGLAFIRAGAELAALRALLQPKRA
ncbi:MAG: thiamine phosphate synthase [Myxococcales bacterium]|nr:thiamine phosphate synthase [Myxococcales bacterium]